MHFAGTKTLILVMLVAVTAACSHLAEPVADRGPEILTIFPDGSMRLMDRLVPAEDVVIYPDGYGGEKAAIKVRLEPLHPAFYRDSIIVRRIGPTLVTDNQ